MISVVFIACSMSQPYDTFCSIMPMSNQGLSVSFTDEGPLEGKPVVLQPTSDGDHQRWRFELGM
jgi:hypothetical protein